MTIDLEQNKYLFKGSIVQQISDDPTTGLSRVIDLYGIDYNEAFKRIEIKAKMHYFNQEGEHLPKFSHDVRQHDRKWVIDNSYMVKIRNEQGQVINGEDGEPLMMPAYDAFSTLLIQMLAPKIKCHIQIDDANKLYNE